MARSSEIIKKLLSAVHAGLVHRLDCLYCSTDLSEPVRQIALAVHSRAETRLGRVHLIIQTLTNTIVARNRAGLQNRPGPLMNAHLPQEFGSFRCDDLKPGTPPSLKRYQSIDDKRTGNGLMIGLKL